ncbi:NAD(P)-dependent oxidoreductase, partial [Streptomyces sp. NPDC005568]|uniref:helix-turn-helix domain-containing protein n=1 Tax=Streptomyces sp. NPDC005568 TaxID=3156887 RepID=UPI0033B25FFD
MSLDDRVRSAVAALLHASGESQSDLAAVLGVTQRQLSRRQSGAASWSLADCVLSLDELLEVADFITVHLPKTPETLGLIGDE